MNPVTERRTLLLREQIFKMPLPSNSELQNRAEGQERAGSHRSVFSWSTLGFDN